MIRRHYKHIIWDWNGTLFDDAQLCVSVINVILEERNIPVLSVERYREVFTFPIREYYVKLGLDFEKDTFEELSEKFIDGYEATRDTCALHQQVEETLHRASKSGVTQSVLSAYPHDMLVQVIERYELSSFFMGLVGHQDIFAASKVENATRWLGEIDYASDEIVIIGDTIHDYEVAQELGVDCILMAHGHNSKNRLQECGAPVVDSFTELQFESD